MSKNNKKIYLVRHAVYDTSITALPGRLPVPLSEEGVKQAEKLRLFFFDKNIKTIYSSPVLRCKQTAEIIAYKKIPIVFDVRLAETLSAYQGYWSNKAVDFYSHRIDLGGETNKEIQERMIDFWKGIILNLNYDNYIICSHGDPLCFLYQYLNNLPLDPEPEPFKLWSSAKHYQPKASIQIVNINNDKTWETKELFKQEEL